MTVLKERGCCTRNVKRNKKIIFLRLWLTQFSDFFHRPFIYQLHTQKSSYQERSLFFFIVSKGEPCPSCDRVKEPKHLSLQGKVWDVGKKCPLSSQFREVGSLTAKAENPNFSKDCLIFPFFLHKVAWLPNKFSFVFQKKNIKELNSLNNEDPFTFLKEQFGSCFTLESAVHPRYFVYTSNIHTDNLWEWGKI